MSVFKELNIKYSQVKDSLGPVGAHYMFSDIFQMCFVHRNALFNNVKQSDRCVFSD